MASQISECLVLGPVVALQRGAQQVHGEDLPEEPGMGAQINRLDHPALAVYRTLVNQKAFTRLARTGVRPVSLNLSTCRPEWVPQ